MISLQYFAALATPVSAVIFVVYYIVYSSKKMKKLNSIEESIKKIADNLYPKSKSIDNENSMSLLKEEQEKPEHEKPEQSE